MRTAADLWEEYRPKIFAAKEADRREAQEIFLKVPTYAGGGIWIEPITVERFLLLDALDHPLLTGSPMERDDVLNLLWICSPEFVPGDTKAAKKFFRRFRFRKLDGVVEAISEYVDAEFGASNTSTTKSDPPQNWVLLLVDTLASEYGWREDEILGLSIRRAFAYAQQIVRRKSDNKAPTFSRRADEAKAEYLNKLAELRAKEKEEATLAE